MRTKRLFALGLTVLLLFVASCSKNPVSNDPGNNGGGGGAVGTPGEALSQDDIALEGVVDTTATGLAVEGTMTVQSSQGDVEFVNADMDLAFDTDGNLTGVSGTVEIPPPADGVEFTNPVEAEVGYFPGTHINANPDFGVKVKDDRWYFVFYFSAALEMKIATNGDPGATKPISIKAPIGGKAIMIIDYEDPMMFTYGEQDLLGAAGTGKSRQGLIPFSPIQPLDRFADFDGKSIRTGSFPVYGVIQVTGTVIQSRAYSVDLMSDDIFASASVGMKAGINGEFDFNVGIKDIVGFTIPLGEASGGASFEASGAGDVLGILAVNGLADPDVSWWPDFIGFKPATQMRTKGSLTSMGDFDLAMSGLYALETPVRTSSFEGEVRIDKSALTMTGRATVNDTTVGLKARVGKDETEYGVELPPEIAFDAAMITERVDQKLAEVEDAIAEYEKAAEDYEFELSLRGLRATLPGIVDEAKRQIAAGISSAKQQVRDAANWCSGSPDLSGIDKLAKPYIDALNRLKNAALYATDNGYFRSEIEGALRDLASRKILKGSVKISGKVRKVICVGYETTRSVNIRVLSDAQANKLITAANNIKYITATSDIMVSAKTVVDQLPFKETLQRVRDEVASGVAKVPSVDELGFTHVHAGDSYHFYAILSGERHDLPPYDPANPGSIVDAVSELIVSGF